jgi:hypothetical protein
MIGHRTISMCAKVRFSTKTYKEKVSMFKRFFKVIDPKMPVAKLKPGDVLKYVVKQKEERSGYAANKDRKNLVAAWNWGMKYLDPPCRVPTPAWWIVCRRFGTHAMCHRKRISGKSMP